MLECAVIAFLVLKNGLISTWSVTNYSLLKDFLRAGVIKLACTSTGFHKMHIHLDWIHPHTHHIVTPGFVDTHRRSDFTADQMDEDAGW